MKDYNEIWNDNNGKLPEEKLLAYLEGRLSPEEQHEVEKMLSEEGMESDAFDGLKSMPANEVHELKARLNTGLRAALRDKKRQNRRYFSGQSWSWLAIFIILILAILSYILFSMSF